MDKIISDAVPIRELQRAIGFQQIAIALDFQLTRLVANLNLKWTVNDSQIKIIVEDLIESFSTESLDDFILCFKKARQGRYGDLMRLDGPIIFSFMRQYLDEKYQLIEAKISQAQAENNEANEINYEKYKERVAETLKRQTNARENEYQRRKLETPYKYFKVRGVQVYATSEAHAEEIIKRLIALGELEIIEEPENNKYEENEKEA